MSVMPACISLQQIAGTKFDKLGDSIGDHESEIVESVWTLSYPSRGMRYAIYNKRVETSFHMVCIIYHMKERHPIGGKVRFHLPIRINDHW